MANEWNTNGNDPENNGDQEYAFQTLNRYGRPKSLGWSVASLVMGALAVATCCFGWSSLVFGIFATVFAAIARRTLGYFDGKSLTGLILGIFGAVFGIVMIIYAFTMDEETSKMIWDMIKDMYGSGEGGGGTDM